MDPSAISRHVRHYYRTLFAERRVNRSGLAIRSGKALALELDYPAALIAFLPDAAWELFAPCGNPLRAFDPVPPGWVLNLGCGTGIDSLALAAAGGSELQVVGCDIAATALAHAQQLASMAPWVDGTLQWVCGDAMALPFREQSFEGVCMNGVMNLFPDKGALCRELQRVLKPAGQLVLADLVRLGELPAYFHDEPDAWAWCMSGAPTAEELAGLLQASGFDVVCMRVEEAYDLFARMVMACRRRPG
jgi:SAM-dependent methyltransferase